MAVFLTARGLARFQSGHPWIYKSDVERVPDAPGIYPITARGKTLAWAAVNPRSEITVRLITRGSMQPNLVSRLERAIDDRRRLAIQGDAFRVVHSDADGLPGLTIDKYGDYLVIQQNSAALEPLLQDFLNVLEREFEPLGILGRFDAKARNLEGLEVGVAALRGNVPDWIEASEGINKGAVRYWVDPWRGQKTGAFLDQRENRVALTNYAFGQALDVFSYHGSFALHLANTCEHVECLDASAPALERARENAALNEIENLSYIVGNAFDLLREKERSGQQYQTISLDPPALAKARRDLEAAYRAYKELNLRAMKLLEPGGILGTASCSFHLLEPDFYTMLGEAAADAGRTVRILERRGQASCHPEILNFPESRYLKYAILEVQ
jgi:23S rRNA (cytosine1962-C5)-methyltransferase